MSSNGRHLHWPPASPCDSPSHRSPTPGGSPARARSTMSSTTSNSCASSTPTPSCSPVQRRPARDIPPGDGVADARHRVRVLGPGHTPHTNRATVTHDDEHFLRRAIELAVTARAAGNPPFGSLLGGPDGGVLAEDRNTVVTDADITAHPEQKLTRWAARELDPSTAAATTMYTSCQPCTMCTGAIQR